MAEGLGAVNWRRGVTRLWLAASVIWIAVNAFVFQVPEATVEITPWLRPTRLSDLAPDRDQTELGLWTKYQKDNPFAKYARSDDFVRAQAAATQRRNEAMANLRAFAIFGVGTPIAVLILGIAGWWVTKGFRATIV